MSQWMGVAAAALSFATPMVIAASGETVVERAGILNIGLEGMLLSSAYAAFYVSHSSGSPWLGLTAALCVSGVLGLLTALFVVKFAADQVLVGTGINLLALGATGSLFALSFGAGGKLVSVPGLPRLSGPLALNPLMIAAVAAPFVCGMLLARTRWGLSARACGESPAVVDALGYSTAKTRSQAVLIGSLCAGIAGAYLTLAQTNTFAPNMTVGLGFVVIAAVTFGRWSMMGSVAASLIISLGYGVQFLLKATQSSIPYQVFDALPYLLALFVLIGAGRSEVAPASLCVPYKKP